MYSVTFWLIAADVAVLFSKCSTSNHSESSKRCSVPRIWKHRAAVSRWGNPNSKVSTFLVVCWLFCDAVNIAIYTAHVVAITACHDKQVVPQSGSDCIASLDKCFMFTFRVSFCSDDVT